LTAYTYDPFGATTATTSGIPNPFQFTGRENDGLAGLYYYRARYYHPGLQHFISEDPLHSPLLTPENCGRYRPGIADYLRWDPTLSRLLGLGFYEVATSLGFDAHRLHPYAYVANNPLNLRDPSGLIAGPQEAGCDVLGRRGPFKSNTCVVQCCAAHDYCYSTASDRCSWDSWFHANDFWSATFNSCARCNQAATKCISNALRGTPSKKDCERGP